MLDKKLCFNLQFNHRSYVKKPMEENRSDKNAVQELAASLFSTDKDGRVKLEYPFVFICCCVGLAVNILRHIVDFRK